LSCPLTIGDSVIVTNKTMGFKNKREFFEFLGAILILFFGTPSLPEGLAPFLGLPHRDSRDSRDMRD